MNQLDEIRAILIKNEKFCQIITSPTRDDCDTYLQLKFPDKKPVYELNFSLIQSSHVVNVATHTSYDLTSGDVPTIADLLNAHKKIQTKRSYGPTKKAELTLTHSRKLLASAQFTLTKENPKNPILDYANAHIKGTLIDRLGEGVEVTGKLGTQDYHHVTQVIAKTLSDAPYIITNPLDCARFMHAAYRALVEARFNP